MIKKFLLLLLFSGASLSAQNQQPSHITDIRNLPKDQLTAYSRAFERSQELFKQKRIFECLTEIGKAEAIYDKNPSIKNLKGACYVEFRSFDKARSAFEEAAALTKDDLNVKFNIAEINFVTRNYETAAKQFQEIIDATPEKDRDQSMVALIRFKRFLSQLKLGQEDEARALLDEVDFLTDNPLYYYGNAALHYHDGELAKAEEWLARGNRIFADNQILSPWQDTLIEFGYIKSFYGGDLEEAAAKDN